MSPFNVLLHAKRQRIDNTMYVALEVQELSRLDRDNDTTTEPGARMRWWLYHSGRRTHEWRLHITIGHFPWRPASPFYLFVSINF